MPRIVAFALGYLETERSRDGPLFAGKELLLARLVRLRAQRLGESSLRPYEDLLTFRGGERRHATV